MEKFSRDVFDLIGVRLNSRHLSALNLYEKELIAWNTRFNLTTIDMREGIHTKHFLDSISCYLALGEVPPGNLIDIGTGAGFPGIPLKILLPQLHLPGRVGGKKGGILQAYHQAARAG